MYTPADIGPGLNFFESVDIKHVCSHLIMYPKVETEAGPLCHLMCYNACKQRRIDISISRTLHADSN